MKILFSILREMADLPNDPDAVALALNSLGLAVEEMDVVGVPVPGVVTARIVRMEKHPDAAKVTRCFVDAGDGEERHNGKNVYEILCLPDLTTCCNSYPRKRFLDGRERWLQKRVPDKNCNSTRDCSWNDIGHTQPLLPCCWIYIEHKSHCDYENYCGWNKNRHKAENILHSW